MKEYRVQPKYFSRILIGRMRHYLKVIMISAIAAILYLYYLHPRVGTFDSWADFFRSSTIKITGSVCGTMVFAGLGGLYVTGLRSLRALVVFENIDHISWRPADGTLRSIYYKDMIKLKEAEGLTLHSKSKKSLVLFIPRQIDDFEELQRTIDEHFLAAHQRK